MSIRPHAARWFEVLVAHDDVAFALATLARTGAVELEIGATQSHALLVDEFELRDDCADLQFPVSIQVRNVADDEVAGVEGDSIPPLDQTPDIVVMTDQFLKH